MIFQRSQRNEWETLGISFSNNPFSLIFTPPVCQFTAYMTHNRISLTLMSFPSVHPFTHPQLQSYQPILNIIFNGINFNFAVCIGLHFVFIREGLSSSYV